MRFLVRTFGCQMNKHDSDRLIAALEGKGYHRAVAVDEADILIFNTCCVREHAENRLIGNVDALRALKKERPSLIIAVTGCLAQRDADSLARRLPHVDIITGTSSWTSLPSLIETVSVTGRRVISVTELGGEDDTETLAAAPDAADKHRAWVAIMTGCDNHCSYCIVPAVRGPEKSRPLEEVVAEVRELTTQGVREVTLLGQNVNSYGRDIYGEPVFARLLEVLAGTDGLRRLRFTTSHPKDMSDEIIDALAAGGSVCPHVHLPVQSGSDKVLGEMGRRYTAAEYRSIAEKIRNRVSGVAITTDIMVGFPGETDADFEQTIQLVKDVGPDQSFMFIYSPRAGTPAAGRADQVDDEIKKARFSRLVDIQNLEGKKRNDREVGRRLTVYVEGVSRKGEANLAGRTENSKLVNFKGDTSLVGGYVQVIIEEAHSWYLVGRASSELEG